MPLHSRTLRRHGLGISLVVLTACFGLVSPVGAKEAYQSSETELTTDQLKILLINEALDRGVPPDLALAVARTESNFNPRAHSSAGARGVMQMMPATALGEFGVPKDQLWDAAVNIRLGVAYLQRLYAEYGRWDMALSHYNGGSRVRQDDGDLAIIPATRKYVDDVQARQSEFVADPILMAVLEGTELPVEVANFDETLADEPQAEETLADEFPAEAPQDNAFDSTRADEEIAPLAALTTAPVAEQRAMRHVEPAAAPHRPVAQRAAPSRRQTVAARSNTGKGNGGWRNFNDIIEQSADEYDQW